jgi:hypothetical protein
MLLDHVVATNNTYFFALITMMLFAIEQYLRKDEIGSIESTCFNPALFVMSGLYIVEAFHITVWVKRTARNAASKLIV